MIEKSLRMKPAIQGGGPNYLGKQKMVTAPKKWLSSPDHEPAELAYITEKEKDILIDLDLYGSLNGKPNRGPAGIMSLQGDMGSIGGGRGGGGGGGGDGGYQDRIQRQAAANRAAASRAAAAAAAETDRQNRNAAAEAAAKARAAPVTDYEAEAYGTPDTIASLTPGPSPHRDGEANIQEQKKLDIQQMIAKQQEEKFGPGADPTKFGETISKLDVAMSKDESDRTIEDKLAIEEYEKTIDYDKVKELADRGESFQDIQKAIDKGLLMKQDAMRRQGLIDRGLAMIKPETKLESSLMGTLKKTFDPKKLATNFALKKLGLSWLNPVAGLASLFFPKQTAAFKSKFSRQPKDMSNFKNLGLYANRQPTDTTQQARVGQTYRQPSTLIAKGKGLESGAELLGLKGIEGQQAKLKGLALAQMRTLEKKKGMSDLGGPEFNPTDQKFLDKLREMDKEEKVYSKPIITVAHGGRIDKPLMGRSRDI